MGFLYFLESIRIPFITELMLLITHLGEETALLVMALIVFWCVDKYRGYYLLGVGLFGNMAKSVEFVLSKWLCSICRYLSFYQQFALEQDFCYRCSSRLVVG